MQKPYELIDFKVEGANREDNSEIINAKVNFKDKLYQFSSQGNGPISAFVNGMRENFDLQFTLKIVNRYIRNSPASCCPSFPKLGIPFNGNFSIRFENFVQNQNSLIFTKEVNNPEEFGVASIGQDQKVIEIIEKPKNPASNLAVVGVYIFDYSMFNKIKTLKPSKRGELEITDLINIYIDKSCCEHIQLNSWWVDAGTPERIIELEENLI